MKQLDTFQVNLDSGAEPLRDLVKKTEANLERLESEGLSPPIALTTGSLSPLSVDSIISKEQLPSPVGTFSISRQAIEILKDQPNLQMVLILRILRYVSPKPWGSRNAQGRRRLRRILEIPRLLVDPPRNSSGRVPVSFAMGSEVLWKPVYYRNGTMREVTAAYAPKEGDIAAWVACRQPPDPQTADAISDRDLSAEVLRAAGQMEALGIQDSVLDVLFDCRFLVSIQLNKIPENVMHALASEETRLLLSCEGRWFHPALWLKTGSGGKKLVHNHIANSGERGSQSKAKIADWVNIQFIRELSSL